MSDVACVVWDERLNGWLVIWVRWLAKPLGPFTTREAAGALAARINGECGRLAIKRPTEN